MVKTIIKAIRPAPASARRVIADLNGTPCLVGLELYFREALGVSFPDSPYGPWRHEYVTKLRGFVDSWLATGRRKDGVETPGKRRPTVEINEVVERVVRASTVLPVAFPHGYSVTLRPGKHPSRQDWQLEAAQAPVKSSVERADFEDDTSYVRALYQERLAMVGEESQTYSVKETTLESRIATNAAERVFVEMLLGDWALKVAECVKCKVYFRLAKWNHRYERGTRCAKCRSSDESEDKGRRVKENRKWAEEELQTLAAERFSRRISANKAWRRDAVLKAQIVDSLNVYIAGDKRLGRAYPKPITSKWLGWAKNYDEITKCAASFLKEGVNAKAN
jgi:hypothetical protein